MRGFLMLCLATLAFSAPQDYVYSGFQQHHQPHQEYGTVYKASALKYLQNLGSLLTLRQHIGQSDSSYSSNSEEKYANFPLQQPSQYLSSQSQTEQQQPIISKRFYLHSAPEDEEDVQQDVEKYINLGRPRKNINVVFIRAPTKPVQRTILKISPSVNEDKTVIYVLAKKQDDNEISAHVVEPITTTAKPEVFFIKYNTQEEAEHAQQSIKSQYEALGGSTFSSNEGVAPLSSVVGALDKAKYGAEDSENLHFVVAGHAQNSKNAYQTQEDQHEADADYVSSKY